MLHIGEEMADIFAVRNVDEKTKEFIYNYAHEHDVNLGEALREIMQLARIHLSESGRHKKKYRSIFEVYNQIAFKSDDPNLSKNIDKVLYGKRD